MGRFNESRKILERAIRINDEDAVTFANLAGVYWELEDYDMAIHNYHRSISLDAEIEETYYNIINLYIETGSLYMAFILCLEFRSRFPEKQRGLGSPVGYNPEPGHLTLLIAAKFPVQIIIFPVPVAVKTRLHGSQVLSPCLSSRNRPSRFILQIILLPILLSST